MRSLEQALFEHDLLTLRVIGEWWELDLSGTDKNSAIVMLVETLTQVDMQKELLFLPPEETAAINDLVTQNGRVPVAVFGRNHGEVRTMGPGRLEREEPWMDPVSATEALWYRGFVYRAFDETPEGVLEFYFIPQELLVSFPRDETQEVVQEGVTLQPMVTPPERWQEFDADAVDDLTALLAVALKLAIDKERRADLDSLLLNPDPERRSFLLTLANEMSLVRRDNGFLRPTRTAKHADRLSHIQGGLHAA